MIVPSNVTFKHKSLLAEYQEIHPALQVILEDMAMWVTSHGFPFVITDLLSEETEDKELSRVSKTHYEGRAADLRCRDWTPEFKSKFEKYFEEKYKSAAAISKETGLPNLVYIHKLPNNAEHVHVQIRRMQ